MAIFPSATDPLLGSGKWSLGPSIVWVYMEGPWVAGVLLTQTWSVGGKSSRPDTAPFQINPFVNFNFGEGWAIGTSPSMTADWEKNRHESWTVPLGGLISRTFVLWKQPMSLSFSSYYNVQKPTGTADWQARIALTLMFPE
jgi:aryl-phospho-beta-D-glucosidase BglC (GH1 family)